MVREASRFGRLGGPSSGIWWSPGKEPPQVGTRLRPADRGGAWWGRPHTMADNTDRWKSHVVSSDPRGRAGNADR